MKFIFDYIIHKLPNTSWLISVQNFGTKLFNLAFRLIQIWCFAIVVLIVYGVYATIKWEQHSTKNDEFQKELYDKQRLIDSIGDYRTYMVAENDKLRLRIRAVQIRIDSLNLKFTKDITNDEKHIPNPIADTDNEAISKFKKRYGTGSIRYNNKVRVNSDSNHTPNKRR